MNCYKSILQQKAIFEMQIRNFVIVYELLEKHLELRKLFLLSSI